MELMTVGWEACSVDSCVLKNCIVQSLLRGLNGIWQVHRAYVVLQYPTFMQSFQGNVTEISPASASKSFPRSPCNQMWLATVQPSVLSRKLRSGSWHSNAFELSVTPSCDRTWFVSTQPSAHVRILVCDSPRIWKLKATETMRRTFAQPLMFEGVGFASLTGPHYKNPNRTASSFQGQHLLDVVPRRPVMLQLVSPRKAGSWAEALEFLLAEMPRAKVWQRCDRQWSS